MSVSLCILVFVLGLRHGLDADHLACIDGLTRHNMRQDKRISPYTGTLFSFGHGFIVATVGVILATVSQNFTIPDFVEQIVTWFSICSLVAIGCLNLYQLLRYKTNQMNFEIRGIKGKLIPKAIQETTNPFLIILIGAIFALAADTVSQTSVWALAAGNAQDTFLPFCLGLLFMVGMMITDTVDSLITYRLLTVSNRVGRTASLVMGYLIVALSFGVALYELMLFFFPQVKLDFEMVGIAVFSVILLVFWSVFFFYKKKKQAMINS